MGAQPSGTVSDRNSENLSGGVKSFSVVCSAGLSSLQVKPSDDIHAASTPALLTAFCSSSLPSSHSVLLLSSEGNVFIFPVPQPSNEILILWLPCLPRKCQQPSNPLQGWWSHLFIGCEMNISRGPCYDFCTEISTPCLSEMAFHHPLAQHTLWNSELTFPIKHVIFT